MLPLKSYQQPNKDRNTEFLKQYVEQLRGLVALYESRAVLSEADRAEVSRFKDQVNYAFLQEDLETLIHNFEEGAKRIHAIISDLRTFSRMESDDFRAVNLHESIDLALGLLQNEYRGRIEIIKDYGTLPSVECHPGRLNQVFMNLLLNACQAIRGEGTIRIQTEQAGDTVIIRIRDDGEGIEPAELDKIFEPFFTTKPVGKGTGLGLSVSYAIIQQHRGSIEVSSDVGMGTEFTIRLPIKR